MHASAAAKFVNIATNLAALAYFLPQDQVLWHYALPMAVCNVLGALSGSWLALRGGSQLVRGVFLLLLVVLIGRFAYEIVAWSVTAVFCSAAWAGPTPGRLIFY